MRRLYDHDSDRYHTAMAASAWVLTMGAFFMIFVIVLGGVHLTVSGWVLGGMVATVILLQIITRRSLIAMFQYLRSRPWRRKPKQRRKLVWQRIPLPDSDGEETTWRPFQADPNSNDWPTEKT